MILDIFKRLAKRASDTLYEGRNRALIILGTDRKKEPNSGYGDGGQNDPKSSTIDLVVGYGETENPDYVNDPSRIYISGKTDPDSYFNITRGSSIEGQPTIVVFSDNSYIVARKTIKIVTAKNHIILNPDGNIEISSDGNVEIKAAGEINLNTSQGVGGRIITENDLCVGIAPSGGGPVICNFQSTPSGALINNNKVKIS